MEMNVQIGYARVSTHDQNLNSQIDALKNAGCEKIYTEVVSGIKSEKKALEEALEYMRESDTLVVWRLDRLGRSLAGLIQLMKTLENKSIGFKSLAESIDTTTPTGKFFFHITGAFAELERNLIRERTRAGLISARSRGKNGGRPKALDDETIKMAFHLYHENTCPVGSICKKFGIAKRTFYRYLERNRNLNHSGNVSN
jgi:DNA invertase Pin-like site-specific DNA recombinase